MHEFRTFLILRSRLEADNHFQQKIMPERFYYYERANLFDLASAYTDGIIRNHPL